MVTIGRRKLFFGYFEDFPAFVLAAVRANPVGRLGLMAVRALGHAGGPEMVMRATLAPARG
jgi:hypothetical protein